jgi:amino acid transporter
MSSTSTQKLGLLNIVGITVAGIFSLRTLPLMAHYGYSAIFLYLLTALFYFIPSALICAELASAFPKTGGVYVWIREAFGDKVGFIGIWLEWVNNVIAIPAALAFMAVMSTYFFHWGSAHSALYTLGIMLFFLWGIILLNLFGIKISGTFSSIGLVIGTLLPCTALIGAMVYWLFKGEPLQLQFSLPSLLPHFDKGSLAFLTGLTLGFAGMQVAAFHAQETKNPHKDFPRAILLSTIIILAISIIGSLAIALILPLNKISLVAGIIDTLQLFLTTFHLAFLMPFAAFCLVFGALASLNPWIIGPAKGLMAVAEWGNLPRFLAYKNKRGAPVAILLCQGLIGTALCFLYLGISVNSFFWLLIVLSGLMTLMMDVLMFLSALRLRYTKPHIPRSYRVPFGNAGLWVVCALPLLTCGISFCLGFIPPSNLYYHYHDFYTLFLVGGLIIFMGSAFIFYRRKTS